MLEPKYKIYLNNKHFDIIYPVEFYNDKKLFYDTGAKLFFTIYQVMSHRKYVLVIEDAETGIRLDLKDELDFKNWVIDNYPMYLNYLENFN